MSSLVDEPPKKKARVKSKVDFVFPLSYFTLQFKIQNSEAGKPQEKSKRPKQSSHTLSKDEETVKRLKVPFPKFVGLYTPLIHLISPVPRGGVWGAKAVDARA